MHTCMAADPLEQWHTEQACLSVGLVESGGTEGLCDVSSRCQRSECFVWQGMEVNRTEDLVFLEKGTGLTPTGKLNAVDV